MRSTAHNSTYNKLAVQWLNEALCFVSIPIAIGCGGRQFSASIRRGRRQLLVAAKRQVVKKLLCIDQTFGYLSDKNFIYAILKGSVLVYLHSAVGGKFR